MKAFRELDKDESGTMDIDECGPLTNLLLQQRIDYDRLSDDEKFQLKSALFDDMDGDKSGFISFHELKVYLTRRMIEYHEGKSKMATASQ